MKTPFYFLLFKAFHAQRKCIRQNMDEYDLSPGQPKVLRYISSHDDCKLKDIAMECDVEPATVSKILNTLEDKGMLTRQIDQKNKRALKLRITNKGREAMKKWDVHCHDVEMIALKDFNDDEIEQFKNYLGRLYFNLSGRELK